MPLASRRDQRTQVRWGLADFVHRFGRRPDGMWLPETAVNRATLAVLAEHGLRFTILAPTQAARVRYGNGAWAEVHHGGIDCTRPYRCTLGGGRDIIVFFYDADIARAVAFGGLLNNGRELAARLAAAAVASPGTPLVHVATDGESYGHHHRFGDMALAAAIESLEPLEQADQFVDLVRRQDAAETVEQLDAMIGRRERHAPRSLRPAAYCGDAADDRVEHGVHVECRAHRPADLAQRGQLPDGLRQLGRTGLQFLE